MNTEELQKKQDAMSDEELLERVEDLTSKLAKTGGSAFAMSVPPEITDSDMIISELVRRYKEVKVTTNKPLSKFEKLPKEIQEKMLDNQVAQGNPRNPEVFIKDIITDKHNCGFNWDESPEGNIYWMNIIR